jgi:hypothetical protein
MALRRVPAGRYGKLLLLVAGRGGMAERRRALTDLAYDLTRSSGRAAKAVQVEIVRSLTVSDLELLEVERGIKSPAVKRIRDSHHLIARYIASGLTGAEIAALTGYSQSRISILKSDPAFMELAEFYRGNLKEIQDDVDRTGYAKAVAIRDEAMDIVLDRLIDTPEMLNTDMVTEIALKFGDRTGLVAASRNSSVHYNVDLTADQVAAGRQRVERLSAVVQGALPAPQAADKPEEGSRNPGPPPVAGSP